MDTVTTDMDNPKVERPSRDEAEEAVRTLIRWAGDNPNREGLVGTPARVARAYEEFFAGYKEDPAAILGATFEETGDYDDVVVLRGIRLESHCEHHIVPIIGKVHVGYLPNGRVVGISKNCATGRSILEAHANTGKFNDANSGYYRRCSGPAWRCCRY